MGKKERKGKGREGKERKGRERKGKERTGKGREGKERKGKVFELDTVLGQPQGLGLILLFSITCFNCL